MSEALQITEIEIMTSWIRKARRRCISLGGVFRSAQSGSVSASMGLLTFVTVSAVGMTIDYTRALNTKGDLQSAVDKAILQTATTNARSEAELKALTDAYFHANFQPKNGTTVTTSYSGDNNTLTYSATMHVPTTILGMVGISSVPVDGKAAASRKIGGTEIVLAVDTTASMGFGDDWEDAKEALAGLLEDLDYLAENQDDFHATFVPFADRVNLGVDRASQWLSVPVPPEGHWGNRSASNTEKGCVEPREENLTGNEFSLTDESPDTLGFLPTAMDHYVSWFANNKSYFACPKSEVIGPTTDMASIATAIDQIHLKGTGRLDIPMAWAHRLLSPKWLDKWGITGYPSAYGSHRKIAILMTDMRTMGFHYEVPHVTDEYHNTPNYGWNQGTEQGFNNIVEICERMKADGIEIHTIYVNGNPHGVQYMKDCATTPENHYHDVTDISDLRKVLQAIRFSIVNVRLER